MRSYTVELHRLDRQEGCDLGTYRSSYSSHLTPLEEKKRENPTQPTKGMFRDKKASIWQQSIVHKAANILSFVELGH